MDVGKILDMTIVYQMQSHSRRANESTMFVGAAYVVQHVLHPASVQRIVPAKENCNISEK